jgi:hypothetical protein
VRELFTDAPARPAGEAILALAEAPDPRQALVLAGVQFLEALAATVCHGERSANGASSAILSEFITTDAKSGKPVIQLPLPAEEMLVRAAAALRTIAGQNGNGK